MMATKQLQCGNCRVEAIIENDCFLGLGKIWIGETLVRSGRLPLGLKSQTFQGAELTELRLRSVSEEAGSVGIVLEAIFRPMFTKQMRDHSFDPIHDLGDWNQPRICGKGQLAMVIRPAQDAFGEVDFSGFSYHYEYRSEDTPLYYLMDLASWEVDGDIVGASVISQSSCSSPVATFGPETAWSTEGIIFFDQEAHFVNPVMTHNLPRWASHQAFDFQYKGNITLLGVFNHVDLIRSIVMREPGKPELKTFDKHIFDETLSYRTSPKKILLNTDPKSETDQRNLWTWVIDEVHRRARAEFGLQEEPMIPRMYWNFWGDFTIDTYYRDLLPAAISLGIKQLFIDNINRSDMTECLPGQVSGNMCCGHEYEPAPRLGGAEALGAFIANCDKHGIVPFSWTNNDQSLHSHLNASERDEEKQWYIKMEDTRLKYGGAYTNVFSIWSFNSDGARENWVNSLKKIRRETGLKGYLFDSFYNLGFMPIDYRTGHPKTHWRKLLESLKELQDADIHFLIESFGPFGQPQHGCPTAYNIENIFACYKIGLGSGYTTIPQNLPFEEYYAREAEELYYILAHMTCPDIPLFKDGARLDALWGAAHKHALADYYENRPHMQRRFLQKDGQSVLWHNAVGNRATLWNFVARDISLPGKIVDLTTGDALPAANLYHLQACHTYAIVDATLPTRVGSDT